MFDCFYGCRTLSSERVRILTLVCRTFRSDTLNPQEKGLTPRTTLKLPAPSPRIRSCNNLPSSHVAAVQKRRTP